MATFAQMLSNLNGGATSQKLDDQLVELVEAVHKNNKVGTMTLKLKLSPNGDNGITIEEDISAKVPVPNRGKSLFFTDDEGNLLRRDPRQTEMQLHDINGAAAKAGNG